MTGEESSDRVDQIFALIQGRSEQIRSLRQHIAALQVENLLDIERLKEECQGE